MVPSSGSTIQRGLVGSPSISPRSSIRKPQSGRALLQFLDQRRRSARLSAIDDEVGRPLAADLQLLDLVEVAPQPRRRLARGALHDGDEAGMGDHDLLLPLSRLREGSGVGAVAIERAASSRSSTRPPPALSRKREGNAELSPRAAHRSARRRRRRSGCPRRYAAAPSRGRRSRGSPACSDDEAVCPFTTASASTISRLDRVGQLHRDRALVVQLHHHVHAVLQERGGVAEDVARRA